MKGLLEDEDGAPYTEGVQAIARERARQITELDYTPEHDERRRVSDFVGAAIAVAGGKPTGKPAFIIERADPDSGYYQRSDLVRAGALIAAAIDRLDNAIDRLDNTPKD